MSDDDNDTGPSGTLVIDPERNPVAAKRSLTAEDEDPATRVADPNRPAGEPPIPSLATNPTVEMIGPGPVGGPRGTMQMGSVGAPVPHEGSAPEALRPSFGALPLGDPRETTAQLRPRSGGAAKLVPLFLGALVALGVGGVGIFLAFRGTSSSKLLRQPSTASMALDDEGDHAPEPPASETAAPSASVAAPSEPDADRRAKAALERFRDGIKSCAETTIHKLPGTSPAVPDTLAWFKHGPYASLKRDWASPFFACTKFSIDEPMPFAIQWQADHDGVHGTGIVWIDDNADGVADRAYSFTAAFTSSAVTTTDIEPTDPTKPLVRPN